MIGVFRYADIRHKYLFVLLIFKEKGEIMF